MACCTGQTNCNHIITIGYLKSFVGNDIQDANGNVVSVNHSDDTYCPTYAELTGGSLIPNGSDKGNGKWSQNVDGIIVGGSYAANQCVKQEDLSAIYTRFESFSITATPNTDIDECGNQTSTMSYTYMLRKYNKAMNSSCEVDTTSSTNSDTASTVSYTPSDNWASVSNSTVSFLKNGTHDAPARTVTITGSVNFRGTSHTDTANITQKALTGEYKYLTSYTEVYSYDSVTVSPTTFDCNGGYWTATGYYTNHNWDVYRWQDSCGVNYDSDKVNRNDTYPTGSESAGSGTAPFIDCESISETYSHTEPISYHGKSESWTQTCEPCGTPPTPCEQSCDSMQTWNEDYEWDETTPDYILLVNECCEVSYTSSTNHFSFYVSVVSGGKRLYAYPNEDNTGSSPITADVDMTITCGNGVCYKSVTITHKPYIPSCTCNDFSVDTTTISTSYAGGSYHIPVTAYCGEIRTSVSDSTWAHVTSTSSTQVDFTVDSTSTARNNTITLSFYYNSTYMGCYSAVTVTQPAPTPGCQCSNLYVTPDELTLLSAASSSESAYVGGVCGGITVEVPSSASSWLTAYYNSSNHYVGVTALTDNDGSSPRSTTVKIKESGTDSSTCEIPLYVTQNNGYTPSCNSCYDIDISVTYTGAGSSSSNPVSSAGGSVTMSYSNDCGNVYVTSDSNITNPSYDRTNKTITFTVPSNSQQIATSYTVHFSYSTTGTHCVSKTIYQAAASPVDPCDGKPCTEMTVTTTLYRYLNCTGESNVELASLDYTTCVDDISVSTDASWLTASTSDDKVYISAPSRTTPTSLRTANVTVSWTVDGQNCSSGLATGQYGCSSSCDCDDLSFTALPYSATNLSSGSSYTLGICDFSVDTCIPSLTISSNVDWVNNLSISEYLGHHITADIEENTGETRYARVTLSYTAGTTPCSEYFDLTQDPGPTPPTPTCGCDDITRISPTALSYTYNYSTYHAVDYTASCGSISAVTEVGDTIVSTISKSGSHRFNIWVNTNDSYSPRSTNVYFTVDGVKCDDEYVVITQDGKPCNCSNANFAVDKTSINIASGGATSISSTRRISWTADCGSVTAEITEGSDWLGFHSTTGSTHRYITASTNNTSSERIGTVKISLDDDSSCYSSVTVTQAAGPAPVTCVCSDLAITSAPYSSSTSALNSSSYDDEEIGNFSASCAVVTGVTSNVSWISDISYYNSGEIYADISTNTSSARSGTVTVNYTANGSSCPSKTFYVWQAGGSTPCQCSNLELSPTSFNFGASTGLYGLGTYAPTDCLIRVVSKPNWVTVGLNLGELRVTAESNTSSSDRNGEIIFSMAGTTCSNKKILVYQDGAETPPQPGMTLCKLGAYLDGEGHAYGRITNSGPLNLYFQIAINGIAIEHTFIIQPNSTDSDVSTQTWSGTPTILMAWVYINGSRQDLPYDYTSGGMTYRYYT